MSTREVHRAALRTQWAAVQSCSYLCTKYIKFNLHKAKPWEGPVNNGAALEEWQNNDTVCDGAYQPVESIIFHVSLWQREIAFDSVSLIVTVVQLI